MPEFLSKVQNTASSLGGRHDRGEPCRLHGSRLIPMLRCKMVPWKHHPKSQGMLVSR